MAESAGESGLCKGGCGFFGCASNNGYCSVCAKKHGPQAPAPKAGAADAAAAPKAEASGYANREGGEPKAPAPAAVPVPALTTAAAAPASSTAAPPAAAAEAPAAAAAAAPSTAPKAAEPTPAAKVPAPKVPDLNDQKQCVEILNAVDTKMASAPASSMATSETPGTVTEGEHPKDENGRPIQTNTNRCWHCRKKVKLMGVTCRCGYTFCTKCRQPEDHECDFDFKENQQRILTKANPALSTERLNKI